MTKEASPLFNLSCFAANLRRAERAVFRLYADEIREAGIEPTQFSLMMVLKSRGELSQGDIARGLAIDSTTLSRTLAPLRERGLIEMRPGADRRVRLYRLTPAGKRTLKRAVACWERAQARLRGRIGDDWDAWLTRLSDITRAAEAA